MTAVGRGGGEITHVLTAVPPPLKTAPQTGESHGVSTPSSDFREVQDESVYCASPPCLPFVPNRYSAEGGDGGFVYLPVKVQRGKDEGGRDDAR